MLDFNRNESLKILQVHNFYQQRGGEDMVVQQEKTLMVSHGHVVHDYFRYNDDITTARDKLNVLLTAHYSKKSRESFRETLVEMRPDIVHVHNFFPLITPSIFDACQDLSIPVIMTLHNYRLVHPNALLINNKGEIDERSVHGSAYACVFDKVYRNSMLQTAVAAHMIEYHRKSGTWRSKVDQFIALTNFAKSMFEAGGVPPQKISIKPNFTNDIFNKVENDQIPSSDSDYFIYVGRLSPEKGIVMLVDTWIKHDIKASLIVIGEGPLLKEIISKARKSPAIKVLGKKKHTETMEYIRNAKALIFPSTWYEGFPMTIVESFCLGIPVIASNIGSQKEIIKHRHNGLHFEKGESQSLFDQVSALRKDEALKHKLSKNARTDYLKHYSPETNYHQLVKIYQEAIEEKNHKP